MRALLQLHGLRRLSPPLTADENPPAPRGLAGALAGVYVRSADRHSNRARPGDCIAGAAQRRSRRPARRQRSVQKHVCGRHAGNVAVQIGDDGVLLVDTATARDGAEAVRGDPDAVRTSRFTPSSTRTCTADHTGGNESLVKQRGAGGPHSRRVMGASRTRTDRMIAAAPRSRPMPNTPASALPIKNAYFTPTRDFFLNGEAIVLYHAPAAHTDGDTLVHFRGSDVDRHWRRVQPRSLSGDRHRQRRHRFNGSSRR